MNSSTLSNSEPKESAKKPLLISELLLSSKLPPALAVMKQSSVSPLPQHRGYNVTNTKTSLPEYRKNRLSGGGKANELTAIAVQPAPARPRYRLEMPKLSIPSRKTRTGSGDIVPLMQVSVLPKLPSLRNQGLSITKTTIASTPVQIPSSLNPTPPLPPPPPPPTTRRVQCDKLLPLQVCYAQSSTPPSTSLPATASVTKSPSLQLKSNSQNWQHDFRFKVPKGPVTVTTASQVNRPGGESLLTYPLHVAPPVDQVTSTSCSAQYHSSQSSLMTTVTNSGDSSDMDWSNGVPATLSNAAGAYANLITSAPVYQGIGSMPPSLSVAQMDQAQVGNASSGDDATRFQDMIMGSSRDDSIQYQDESCNSSSMGHATAGCDGIATLGDVFDASQPLLQNRDTQEFANQQSMVWPSTHNTVS